MTKYRDLYTIASRVQERGRELARDGDEVVLRAQLADALKMAEVLPHLLKDLQQIHADHTEMVARNQLLRDRPDLTAEQVAERLGWKSRADTTEAEVVQLREVIWKIHVELGALVADPKKPDWTLAFPDARQPDIDCLQAAYTLTTPPEAP